MADHIDKLVETAMCDPWWFPDHTQVVARPEIQYSHSTHPARRFNSVVRVQPDLPECGGLVAEVVAAHDGCCSEWRLAAPSRCDPLEKAIAQAG